MTVLVTLKVGDRVLVQEGEEGTVIAIAEVQTLDTTPQRPFVKVQYDRWFKRSEWHPHYRIAVIKTMVEVER